MPEWFTDCKPTPILDVAAETCYTAITLFSGFSAMVVRILSPQFLLLWAFIGSALTVHLRGKVRLGFWRQVSDHSTLMAPYNVLMYIFSGVPNKPILEVGMVPDLSVVRDNWQTHRAGVVHSLAQGE